MTSIFRLSTGLALIGAALFGGEARAANTPAQDALAELRGETVEKDVVQNRFFLKAQRFEVAPVLGAVPNDPMVRRYTLGVLLAYHFSETFAVGGQLIYSPDLGSNELKGLTNTLVQIAHNGDASVEFQQPVDKMVLGATFSANWIPVYGKINLVGETVLNFDLYGSAGIGMLSIAQYAAVYDANLDPPVTLNQPKNDYRPPITLAIGTDFFITQTLALKVEARSYLHVGPAPQYDQNQAVTERRLYNTIITSAGLSMYFPKMSPRITSF